MRDMTQTTSNSRCRRWLLPAAWRLLWTLLGACVRVPHLVLRRRPCPVLAVTGGSQLLRLVRPGTFTAAAATALFGAASTAAAAEAIDLADVAAGSGGYVVQGASGGAQLGWSLADAGDVNGDGTPDAIIGGSFWDHGRPVTAPSYVVFGKADGGSINVQDVAASSGGFVIRGESTPLPGDLSGASVSGAGDIDGDGLSDLLIGAPYANPGGRERAGASYVVFGKRTTEPVELSDIAAGNGGFVVRGESAGDFSGGSVSGAGDVNGDGIPDVLIGASEADLDGREYAGASYVVFGKRTTEPIELSDIAAGNGGFVVRGESAGDFSGWSVSGAGDVDGDGLSDILIGILGRFSDRGGRSCVVFGRATTDAVELADIESGEGGFVIRGEAACCGFSGGGDVNGDGLSDIVIWAGKTYVVFGKTATDAVQLSTITTARSGFEIRVESAGDLSFLNVSGAGDVDGDGLSDILIGAPWDGADGAERAGASYVVFGKPTSDPIELSDVEAGEGGLVVRGESAGDFSGISVSGAGDVDGDGLSDLLIGAPGVGSGGKPDTGAMYVIFGHRREEVPTFRRGDCNDDGTVDISDAVFSLGALFLGDGDPGCDDACDSNDDGAVDISDAIATLGVLFLGNGMIPPPGMAECGVDPTADMRGCDSPPKTCP